jgi:hypothetical protein
MSAATNYTKTSHMNAQLRGVAFPLPAGTYIALHTSDPATGGGVQTEVSVLNWPAYTRKHAENGGAIGTGWTAPVDESGEMVSRNLNILSWNPNNGALPQTITHWSIWDASGVGAGNMLVSKPLAVQRIIGVGDIFVFPAQSLTYKMP